MACETKASLSPFIDGELREKERDSIQAHLDVCGECRKDVEGMRAVGRLLRSPPERPLPEGFRGRLMERRLAPKAAAFPTRRYGPVMAFACAAAAFAVYQAARPALAPQGPPPAEFPAAAALSLAAKGSAGPGRDAARRAAPEELTNEVLHGRLQEEAKTMGIKGLDAGGEPDIAEQALRSHTEGPTNREEARIYMRRLAALRRAMGVTEPLTIPLAGKTSILLSNDEAATGKPLKADSQRQAASEPVAGALEHGWAGLYGGGNDAGTQTVTDADSWKKLWKSLSTAQLPPVDFARFEVVAVFLGPRPSGGFHVDIEEAKTTESFVLVRYKETAPPEGRTPPEGMTSPFILRVIDKSSLPVRFEAARQ